jgi:RND superfamily putative drug exporter
VLQGIARLAIAAPRRVIALAVLVMIATAIFGIPVVKSLSAGGLQDPTAESAHATQMLSDKFDQGDMKMIIAVTSNDGVHSSAARGRHGHRRTTRTVQRRGRRDVGVDRAGVHRTGPD